jgi:hypothetical protein
LNEDGSETCSTHIRLSTENEDWFYIGKDVDTTADSEDDYLDCKIFENDARVYIKPLIKLNDSEFFLQTYDFNITNETGMRIDLQEGKITAYRFCLEAGTTANDEDE